MTDQAAENTDRELYREPKGDLPSDYYASHVYVTDLGTIGMCVGGKCRSQSIANWMRDADVADRTALAGALVVRLTTERDDALAIVERVKALCDEHAQIGFVTVEVVNAALEVTP